jgi:phosphoribosylformimino-5-aminoimidazole carboxamide ribotide isomerase
MKFYPAIDILGGNAVRLVKGEYDTSKVYDEDPLLAARRWVKAGARQLHVVDLDGARVGTPGNLLHLRRICAELEIPVQFGGGLRSMSAINDALSAGAMRIVLGTAALTDPDFLDDALREWPGKVLVSVDVRGGLVATSGWTQTSELTAREIAMRLSAQGASQLIYTDIDRDGMFAGPDLEGVRKVAQSVSGSVIYSGGISNVLDLVQLARLGESSLAGVIVGKALYEGRFSVGDAHAALD